jgi:hypothetical protein
LLIDSFGSPDRRADADRHGRAIFHLEQRLHLDIERPLNHWLAPHEVLSTLANYEYAWTYILSAIAMLTWIGWRRPDLWLLTRDSFIVMNLVAFACFWLYPTTPPRLLPDLGFVDTVSREGGTVGSWGTHLVDTANQLAAMPSLHVGWALWVSVVLARITARRWVQFASASHVALTVFVVMATANHYLLDAVAVAIPIWIGVRYASWRHETPGIVVPSSDAFFLHIESTGAAQHVGGVVVLDPSDHRPSIEEVRELVRDGFARQPRMHQRLAPPSRWRRPRWIEAEPVDLDWHVVELHSTDGRAGMLRIIGDLAETPMPRDRPMWRVAIVRDVGPGGADAVVVLVHHSIADGIGTVLQGFKLFEPRADIAFPTGGGPGRLQRAAAVAVGLAQLATDGTAAPLPASSLRRDFNVADVELDVVRRTAADRGVRVTDLVIALVADALYAVAPGLARAVEGKLRISVTTMVRTPHSAAEGNATAAVIVDVPVDGQPFDELLAEVSARTRRLRRPTRALASRFVMATGLRVLPEPCARWFARTVYGPRFLHGVVSNMPGPTITLTFAGIRHDRTYPILPLVPTTPLAVGALSWTGVLGIGLATDPQLVDGAALARHLDDTLSRLRETAVSGRGPLEGEEEARA